MFVVMASTATEAEILGVKSHILGEGMTPYDHAGADRVVIAVVGEVGPRRQALMSKLGALPGVEGVAPGKVVILGAGSVGANALAVALANRREELRGVTVRLSSPGGDPGWRWDPTA